MLSGIFIDRPRLAVVISLVITIAGLVALTLIPIAQFPDIVPPQVSVSVSYPGASADVVQQSIAQPIESRVVGVDNAIYMKSTSGNDGSYTLTVSFAVGTDPDINTVNVQNRVNLAEAQLPQEAQAQGISVTKKSSALMQLIALTSASGEHDQLFLSNYATINMIDGLKRIKGVGDVVLLTPWDYSMRIWITPERLTSYAMTPSDIVTALQGQNIQAAIGRIGSQPALPDQQFQLTIQTKGRLATVEEFGNVVLRAEPDGSFVRIRDVARVELAPKGAEQIGGRTAHRRPFLASTSRPAAMPSPRPSHQPAAGETRARIPGRGQLQDHLRHDEIRGGEHPRGRQDPARGLRSRRHRRLPVPRQRARDAHSADRRAGLADRHLRGDDGAGLFGQYGVAAGAGACHRHRRRRRHRRGRGGRGASGEGPDRNAGGSGAPGHGEITAPIIAITLVLLSVFMPVAFIPGISGELFRQFAVAVSVSMVISAINALSLSPALCAVLLKPQHGPKWGPIRYVLKGIDHARDGYASIVRRLVRLAVLGLVLLVGLIAGTGWLFKTTPTGFPAFGGPGRDLRRNHPAGRRLGEPDECRRQAVEEIMRHRWRPGRDVGRRLQPARRAGEVECRACW
jgi:hypothetical protein